MSKIEHAARPISLQDLRTWCRICDVPERRVTELLAEQRAVAGMWVTYKQLNRGGLKRTQESVRNRYERVRVMRVYLAKAIHSLLQTSDYTTAALISARHELAVDVDDVTEAVAERMDRQHVLLRPGRRFVFLLE